LTTLFSCTIQSKKVELNTLEEIQPANYSEINQEIQNILIKNNGKFPIIKFEKTKGDKHLFYLGEQHGNDPNDSRFDTIQKYFSLYNPTILLNEGGQVEDSIHFKTREEAIQKKGTIGFLKYLADSAKIKLQNADCPDSTEISFLLKKYDKDKILYFVVIQRFIPQFLSGYNGATDLKTEYLKFTEKYLITRCNLKLSENEKEWKYFENLYSKNNENKKINLKKFDMSQTVFDSGEMEEINKSSLEIRDKTIIENIYRTFKNQDNVFIVFGALHLLAEKPSLERLFE
jgi:hypothetical protein